MTTDHGASRSANLSEQVYRTLFEQAGEPILITDPEGRIVDFNRRAHESLGYSRQEFAGLDSATLGVFVDPADPATWEATGFPCRLRTGNGQERTMLVATSWLNLPDTNLFRTTWREIPEQGADAATLRQSVVLLAAEKENAEAIVNAIGEAITVRDRNFRITYQNRSSLEMVGDRLGEECYRVFHGRDEICVGCPVALSFADGQIHTAENIMELGDRREYMELTSSPLRSCSGQVVAAIELARNVSSRKLAEQGLREANLRMEALLHAIPDLVVIKDVEGRHLMVNRAAEEIIGLPSHAFLGKTIEELSAPEVAAHCRKTDEEAMRSRRPVHFEEEMPSAVGGPLYLDTIKAPIQGHDGTMFGVVMVSRDITTRKRAEEKIRTSEKRLRDITANLGVGLYVTDNRGEVIFMNPMAEQLWGWSLDELRDGGVHDRVHVRCNDGSDLKREECEILRVIDSGQPYASTEENFLRKDGTVFPVSLISTPLQEDDRIIAAVTAFRDITAEKKLEAELLKVQKLESVGLLAGGIAHDFNNILQAILGGISLARLHLERSNLERIPALLQQASEASEAAKELSFRLLTFSKGGSPVKRSVSLAEIIGKSISLSLSGSKIHCIADLPADLPPVLVDDGQMMQVFNNILINAKEAMPQGGQIVIAAEPMTVAEDTVLPLETGDYLKISVQDSGCGIPAEDLARVFDPYFSKKCAGSPNGSGLGLSICLAVVRKHGGHLSVESRPGQGTTFHIHLPLAGGVVPVKEVVVGNELLHLPSRRILFMDDDDRVIGLVGEMMTALGCEVEYARHGDEAVAHYCRAREAGRPFAGVVLDLTIKGGPGGEETMARLREIDPAVKAVISSGYADNPVMRNFREYGFLDAVAKPFDLEQLRRLLTKLPPAA